MPPRKKDEKRRPVLYPEPLTEQCIGKEAITVTRMKELLGWTEVEERKLAHFRDRDGKYILCTNNISNRPLYMSKVEDLVLAHLHKRWEYNGEPIIIGKTGLILNGQHSGISLILADQDRLSEATVTIGTEKIRKKDYWKEFGHSRPITMEKLIVFGIEEDDKVINTMDTCKPRSLADVVFRSSYFAKLDVVGRRTASRMLDYAVRFMWRRSRRPDAFTPKKGVAEALDYTERHPRIVECVQHILSENKAGSISKYYSPGYAAGLCYLMATSATEQEVYLENPCEESVDWEHFEAAQEFWRGLPFAPKFLPVREALGHTVNDEEDDILSTYIEKTIVLLNAWNFFVAGKVKKMTVENLRPITVLNGDGVREIVEFPTIGGLDLGEEDTSKKRVREASSLSGTKGEKVYNPTPEEIQKGMEEARKLREQEEKASKPRRLRRKKVISPLLSSDNEYDLGDESNELEEDNLLDDTEFDGLRDQDDDDDEINLD